MRKQLWRSLGAGLLVALAAAASADTLTVRQDGSGDHLTIGAAVTAALAGDLIDIGAGTYYEQVVVDKALSLVGTSGAAATIIDGSLGMRPLKFEGAIVGSVEGITLAHGLPTENSGGGLRVQGGAQVVARDCVLAFNTVSFDGGGYFVWQSAQLELIDCELVGNYAANNGAAGQAIQGAVVSLTGCTIHYNSCGLRSGGLGADSATLNVTGCLFVGNSSEDITGGLFYSGAWGSVSSSTFYRNSSPGPAGGTVTIDYSPAVSVERCIFAEDLSGAGIEYTGAGGPRACNLFWANADGPIQGDMLEASEVVAEPMFCNPDDGIFSIASTSMAAPAHSPCGLLIGAFPVACGPTGVQESSWSAVKSLY
jgi:hypothetical protein